MHRIRARAGVRGLTGLVLVAVMALAVPAAPVAAQGAAQGTPACALLTPADLSAVVDAAFGEGSGDARACTWQTETRSGRPISIQLTLEAASLEILAQVLPGGAGTTVNGLPGYEAAGALGGMPAGLAAAALPDMTAAVTVQTTAEEIDPLAVARQLLALVVARILAGGAPSPGPAAGALPVPCDLLTEAEVETALATSVTVIGDPSGCLWTSEEPGRSLVGVTMLWDPVTLDEIARVFGDATDEVIGGFPAKAYGWPTSLGPWSVSVDLGGTVLTVSVGHDDEAVDRAALARQLAETALARMSG